MSINSKNNGGTKVWAIATIPQVKSKKAYVLPGAFYGAVVSLMAEGGYQKADDVDSADVVVFVGGSDISPTLYGDKNVASGGINTARDEFEVEIYHRALNANKVMFGICRGAQFLHAMNGGKLWQDVEGHGGRDHWIVDLDEDVRVLATSIHHQMLIDNEGLEVLAVCEDQVSKRFIADGLRSDIVDSLDHEIEIEAGSYPATKCFFVQGHPEVGCQTYKAWTMSKLHDFLHDWSSEPIPIQEVLKNKVITVSGDTV